MCLQPQHRPGTPSRYTRTRNSPIQPTADPTTSTNTRPRLRLTAPDARAQTTHPTLDSAMPKAATRDTVVPAGTASAWLSGDGATQLNGFTTSTTLLVHARSRPHV